MSLPLIALFLAAFAFGTAEFVIAGVLPEVAQGIGVTVPVAGYLISGYAIGIAVGGPLLTLATKKMSRKTLILLLGGVFVAGQVFSALAPNFELLMLSRLLVSVVHGTYFGIAAIVAVSISPANRRGFAVALILAGLTVSNILGVPGGTAVGSMLGWRATFWAVGAVGLVATLAIALFLPARAGEGATASSFSHEFKALGRQQVWSSLLIAALVMVGQYSLFTYIAPFLLDVTRLDSATVPWILLVYGIGSTLGVFIGGRLADWNMMRSLTVVLSLQAILFVIVHFVSPYALPMAILTLLWGGTNFAFGSPLQARILIWASDAPNLASSLIPTAYNVGIALGAILGAVLLEADFGYANLPLIGAVASTLSVLLAIGSHLAERRSTAVPPNVSPAE
jgi:DHA1 family inner membrane transport protein